MATQLFLLDAVSDINPGAEDERAIGFTRGGASATYVTTLNTTASPNNFAQATKTAGGTIVAWYSPQLTGFSMPATANSITVNIRASENANANNAYVGVKIERTNSAGAVQSTVVAYSQVTTTELTTSDSARNATFTPTATTFTSGDRIKVTLYARGNGTTAMGGTGPATFTVNGASAAAAGDTYVTVTETVTQFDPNVTVTPTVLTLALATVAPTIIDSTLLLDATYETGDFTQWTSTSDASAQMTVQSVTKFAGTYAHKLAKTAAVVAYASKTTAKRTMYVRLYLYIETMPTSGQRFDFLSFLATAVNNKLSLLSTGELRATAIGGSNTLIGVTLVTGQWYRIDAYSSTGTTTPSITVRVNEVEYTAVTGTQAAAVDQTSIRLGDNSTTASSGTVYFDKVGAREDTWFPSEATHVTATPSTLTLGMSVLPASAGTITSVTHTASVLTMAMSTLAATAVQGTVYYTTVVPTKDTWVSQGNPTFNYGGSSGMSTIGRGAANPAYAMVQFDLSTLPEGATVTTATLKLWNQSTEVATRTFDVYRRIANQDWDEGTLSGSAGDGATWNQADTGEEWAGGANGGGVEGIDLSSTILATFIYTGNSPADTQHTIPMQGANVQADVGTTLDLVIKRQGTETPSAPSFRTRLSSSTSSRPVLVVAYTIPPSITVTPATLTLALAVKAASVRIETVQVFQPAPAVAKDTRVQKNNPTFNYGTSAPCAFTGEGSTSATYMLMDWDLSTIPTDVTITSAVLSLTVTAGTTVNRTLKAYKMIANSDWVEGTGSATASTTSANWNTKDGVNAWAGGANGGGVAGVDIDATELATYNYPANDVTPLVFNLDTTKVLASAGGTLGIVVIP